MPARILAFMNQKGGVGKTTTTVNLGAALAQAGKSVCLVDLDPQAHLTINYGLEPSSDSTSLYDVLVNDAMFLEAMYSVGENLAVVPSSIDLAGAEIELVSVLGRELVLKKRIEAAEHDFDYILLDCPPSLGLLTINGLAVAHEVMIPMQPHFLALQGMAKLLETVQLVNQRMNPKLTVGGIMLTMFDSQAKLSHEVIHELVSFVDASRGQPVPWANAKVFNTRIRRNIKLAESPSFGKPIYGYDPTSNGAIDYKSLAREVIEMVEPRGHSVGATISVPTETPPESTASEASSSDVSSLPVAGSQGNKPELEVSINPDLSRRPAPGITLSDRVTPERVA